MSKLRTPLFERTVTRMKSHREEIFQNHVSAEECACRIWEDVSKIREQTARIKLVKSFSRHFTEMVRPRQIRRKKGEIKTTATYPCTLVRMPTAGATVPYPYTSSERVELKRWGRPCQHAEQLELSCLLLACSLGKRPSVSEEVKDDPHRVISYSVLEVKRICRPRPVHKCLWRFSY